MAYLLPVLIGLLLSTFLLAVYAWHGGNIFSDGETQAQAMKTISSGREVQTAAALFRDGNDGQTPTSLSVLRNAGHLEAALADVSATTGTTRTGFFITTTPSSDIVVGNILWGRNDVCDEINAHANATTPPARIDAVSIQYTPFGCVTSPTTATVGVSAAAGEPMFFLRL